MGVGGHEAEARRPRADARGAGSEAAGAAPDQRADPRAAQEHQAAAQRAAARLQGRAAVRCVATYRTSAVRPLYGVLAPPHAQYTCLRRVLPAVMYPPPPPASQSITAGGHKGLECGHERDDQVCTIMV